MAGPKGPPTAPDPKLSCFTWGGWATGFVICTISLILILILTILSIKQLRNVDIQSFIKRIYFTTCFITICVLQIMILLFSFCGYEHRSLHYFCLIGYNMLISAVLAMLLLRLHYTFKHSMWAITEKQKWIFRLTFPLGLYSK